MRSASPAVSLKEGIRRAYEEINKADKVLLLIDANDPTPDSFSKNFPTTIPITKIYNKIDLLNIEPEIRESAIGTQIYLSLKTGEGLSMLKQYLKQSVGYNAAADNVFIARRRHLEALNKALLHIDQALIQLENMAGELVAEDLRQAQNSLSEITGEFPSDDLLGEIFSSFCIGK